MSQRQFILTSLGLESLRTRQFEDLNVEADDQQKTSVFGTPIWSNLIFPAGNYQTLEGDEIELEEIEFDTVLLSVSQSKTIITTAVQGRPGTVKEFISLGDYVISITGAIVGESSDVYPERKFLDLLEQLNAPVSLKVESEFLNFFDIDEIVVTGYDMGQRAGSRNTQLFSIGAISDSPIELKELNNI